MRAEKALAAQQAAQPVADHVADASKMVAAQPVAGEPVASIYITPGGEREMDDWRHPLPVGRNILYTAAPAPVVPLTDERIWELVKDAGLDWHKGFVDDCNRYAELVKLAEAAHGIKAGKDGAK